MNKDEEVIRDPGAGRSGVTNHGIPPVFIRGYALPSETGARGAALSRGADAEYTRIAILAEVEHGSKLRCGLIQAHCEWSPTKFSLPQKDFR